MKTITWVPGKVDSGDPITIPTEPDIDAVVFAVICRMPSVISAHAGGAVASADCGGGVHEHSFTQPGDHTGANPVVAAIPTKLTTRTISLDVDTELGDILSLSYLQVGERVLTS